LFHPHPAEDVPERPRCQFFRHVFDLEYDRANRSLHVWLGPSGLHLFWPDVWKSRADWCSKWREPLV